MTTKPITREAFNTLRDEFLAEQDDTDEDDWFGTDRGRYASVIREFEQLIFDRKQEINPGESK